MIEKDLLFDVRILKRNLDRGLLTREEVRKFRSSQKNLAGSFETREIGIREGEFDLGARELSMDELLEREDAAND
ncbi:MAG: hypothetical protein FJ098_02875 [Deltaproteobacteria bacterium]|nr:hypothetical protein [Deltaproteobacteria bacterium]